MNVKITKPAQDRMLIAAQKLTGLAARWLTRDEQQLIKKLENQGYINTDAAFLYLLYTDYGFTPEQLNELMTRFQERYAMYGGSDEYISGIPEVELLRALGVDVAERYEAEEL